MYKKILAACLSLSLVLLGVGLGRLLPRVSAGKQNASGPAVTHAHAGPIIEPMRGLSSLTVLKVDVADVQVTELRGYTGGAKAALVVKGDLTLSTDLSQATFESINPQRAATGRLGEARPGTIADFAIKHVRNGRHVGGSQDGARDVMSPVMRRRGVRVVSYDADPSGPGREGWKQLVAAGRRASVADLAAFRLDFARWLATLTRRDRGIIAAYAAGERTSAVAERFCVTAGRVSQLRRKYERLWNAFHGESSRGRAA